MQFCCARGLTTTHALRLSNGQPNTHPRAGEPYDTFDWDGLRNLLYSPCPPPKLEAFWAIFSDEHGPNARNKSQQIKTGMFYALAIDMDKGSLPKDRLIANLQMMLGHHKMFVYTTASATPTSLRWRAIIPLAEGINAPTYEWVQKAMNNRLAPVITCDRKMERCSQIMFLPVDGPAYDWAETEGPELNVRLHPLGVQARELYVAHQTQKINKAAASVSDREFLIRSFNEMYPLLTMFTRYGFETLDEVNWRHHSQSSKGYGTMLWDDQDKAFTLSETVQGMLHGKHYFDSQDLFASLEFGGDYEKAMTCVRALAYGWRLGESFEHASYYLQLHHYKGWELFQTATVNGKFIPGSPLHLQRQTYELEQAAAVVEELAAVPQKMAEGEWDIDWPPGGIGVAARHIYANSRKPVKQYAIAMAFYLMAGLAGRRYMVYNMGLNLYMILSGATGTGKGSARSVMNAIIKNIADEDRSPAINDVFAHEFPVSGPAVRKSLGRGSPIKAFFQEDADDVLKSLANAMGMGPGIKSALLAVWDQAGEQGILGRIEHSKAEDSAESVQRPSLTFALDTQLEPSKEFLGSSVARTSGFGSRLIFIEYDGEIKPTNHAPKQDLEKAVLDRLTQVWQLAYRAPNDFVEVNWHKNALSAFLASDEINRQRMNDHPHVRGLLSRTPMNVNKHAALMAVMDNPLDPRITLEQWEWAQAWMVRSTSRVVQMVEDGETGSGESIREWTAVKAVKEYMSGAVSRKTKRDTYCVPLSIIDHHELVPEKYLKKKLKMLSPFKGTDNGKTTAKLVEDTIEQLVKDEVLATVGREALVLRFGLSITLNTLSKIYTAGVSFE